VLKSHWLKTLVGLAITVVLLAWVLRDVSASEVLTEIADADPFLLIACVVAATASFFVRALRWHVLLLPGFPDSSLRSRFATVCIGFSVNNVLPARLGEFARAYSFSRIEPIPVSQSIASIVVERVFDAVVLGAFFVFTLSYGNFTAGDVALLRGVGVSAGLVFASALVLLWAMARWPKRTLNLVERTAGRFFSPSFTDRAIGILASFLRGLGALHNPAVFVRALAWSIATWLCLAASIWLGLLAFGIVEPGFIGAVFVQAVLGFAVAVPSSPGFFGPFEAAARLALGAYGVDSVRIVSFAVGYHVLTFIPVTVLGFYYLYRLGIRWSEVEHSEELVEEAVEHGADAEEGDVPSGRGSARATVDAPAEGGPSS
jgi:uncharacterized protein (TIRG00374 family)